nr:mesocentin [Mycolicibacterium mageritense]
MCACGSEPSTQTPSNSPGTPSTPGGTQPATPNAQYCAQNRDAKCPKGSFHGPHVVVDPRGGYWDANGNPVNGGPMGADGSTGNALTQEYCARNQDPGCPMGSYVAPNAIKNPDGSPTYVGCEGTICTNPNYGANVEGYWDSNGNPVDGGPMGADGSTGNRLTQEYCARNQDPGCPIGSYVGPNAMRNPDGSPGYVTCEGTICTNPNHGANDSGNATDPSDDGPPPGNSPAPQEPDTGPSDGNPFEGPPEPGQPTFTEDNPGQADTPEPDEGSS